MAETKAATTRITIKGHVTGPLYYSPFKSRENLLSRIFKKGSAPLRGLYRNLGKSSGERKESGCIVIGASIPNISLLPSLSKASPCYPVF